MYRFYQDIKEEEQEIEFMKEYFRFGEVTKNGPFNIETEKYKTSGICLNGLPVGLVIIRFKQTRDILTCSFNNEGIPNGEWILYDKIGRIKKKKSYYY